MSGNGKDSNTVSKAATHFMRWLPALPDVGASDLSEHHRIEELIVSAALAEKQARDLRATAYRAALALEASVRERWTDDEIEQAERNTR